MAGIGGKTGGEECGNERVAKEERRMEKGRIVQFHSLRKSWLRLCVGEEETIFHNLSFPRHVWEV